MELLSPALVVMTVALSWLGLEHQLHNFLDWSDLDMIIHALVTLTVDYNNALCVELHVKGS